MRTLLLAATLVLTLPAQAQLRLPLVLSDGAVLQRNHPVPVWGWSRPGAPVDVALGGHRATTTADAAGRWRVELPAMPAGGLHTLEVRSGRETAAAHGLLVGDVWVLSGQSNMEWILRNAQNAEAAIATSETPFIRHFKVPLTYAEAPQDEIAGGEWVSASPETAGAFSAIGYFFARDVQPAAGVPIGLINTTWGGSRIEPWMSAQMLGLDAAEAEAVFDAERNREARTRAELTALLGGPLPTEDAGMAGGRPVWAAPDLDDTDWATLHVPGLWEGQGYPGLDGIAWYRTTVTLSDADIAGDATLHLAMIDDGDVAWVNGIEVGRTPNAYNVARAYTVPASALRAGSNVLAVRVEDFQVGGGIYGADDQVALETASGRRVPLAGDWRFRVAVARVTSGSQQNQIPMGLWNQMVAPLTHQPVAGVLWYQGESNANTAADAEAYAGQFQSLIRGWRAAWSQPDLPFFWVQLASFHAAPTGPDDTGIWPILRASQSAALALDRTAEVITLDVGDADDIHPRDKRTVGHRLADAARAIVYGHPEAPSSSPRYQSHVVDGSRVVLTFAHATDGLTTRDGLALGGFALQDQGGAWHWAQTEIDGARVTVWSEGVDAPAAVRYGWADNPEPATLQSAGGLPAAPFSVQL